MVRGRLPQRRAQGAIPLSLSTARGQPDMNTLHLILPKPSLTLLIAAGLTGSLNELEARKQQRSGCTGRRPAVADEGGFINTTLWFPTML